MGVPSLLNVFKKAMGPSSSHTLGALRAGLDFRRILEALMNDKLSSVDVTVELLGSFAYTGKGHLTDLAAGCGLLGYKMGPEQKTMQDYLDEKIKEGLIVNGKKLGFQYPRNVLFNVEEPVHEHPNTIRFKAADSSGSLLSLSYISYGGGNIRGPFIEQTSPPFPASTAGIFQPAQGGEKEMQPDSRSLENINNMDEILEFCRKKKLRFHEFALQNEHELGIPRLALYRDLKELWSIMEGTIEKGLTGEGILPGRLALKRRARDMYKNLIKGIRHWRVMSEEITLAAIYAIGVGEENASGSLVVTAPTCGSAGVIPAVFKVIQEKYHKKNSDIVNALITAGLFGAVALKNASVSGAYVGCQGEIGVASSMAAAGAAYLLDGNIHQIEFAAEVALEHHLGLTCDPIDGLVQIPCIERNAAGAVAALNAVNMALLTDGSHNISYDSVLEVMIRTGKDMNSKYKETSQAGLATAFVSCPNIPLSRIRQHAAE